MNAQLIMAEQGSQLRPQNGVSLQNELNLAVKYHTAGHLAQAAGIYQSILARVPNHANTLHLLGVVSLQQGDAARAVALIGRAISLQPNIATFHCHLALAYHALGSHENTAASCRAAVALQPSNAEAVNTWGLALQELGQFEEAVKQFRSAVQLQPDFAAAHVNLGNALRLLGETDQAIASFRAALDIDPNMAIAHTNLGPLLLEKHEVDKAFEHCSRAVRLCPSLPQVHVNLASVFVEREQNDNAMGALKCALRLNSACAEAHNGLGRLLQEQGHSDDAKKHYREAIRSSPRLVAAHCNLGELHGELGAFDEAQNSLRDALRLDPRNVNALGKLATMMRGKLPDSDVGTMRQLLNDPTLRDMQRATLHFGLAQVLDARNEFSQASAHLRFANRLTLAYRHERGEEYDPLNHEVFVANVIDTFTPAFFASKRGLGLATETPVFVVGMPRSGTTLVEQILASHSKIFGAGELSLAAEDLEALPALTRRSPAPLACLPGLTPEEARTLAQRHLDRLMKLAGDLAPGKTQPCRIVDKMPENYFLLGLLALLFPRAKFIHCRRDQRDVAFSCWMTNFSEVRWASDPQHIVRRFADYRRMMHHWQQALPVPVLEVNYEETVTDLEGTARRLINWCGLEWEAQCLAFHKTERMVRTASTTQVRQPIYKRSVARWKHYEADLADLFTPLSGE